LFYCIIIVIQMVTQSVKFLSARLLIYIEILYRQRRTKNLMSLSFCDICAYTFNTFCEHGILLSTIKLKFTEYRKIAQRVVVLVETAAPFTFLSHHTRFH
jgi:ABC-type xylose transport system permease subunit